jgi:hypothetical protein
MSEFFITSENLIENLKKIGPWSSYGLAVEALRHYFPNEYQEYESPPVQREVEMLKEIGCEYWQDAIIKYQNEVGYKTGPEGFNPDAVNKF